MSCFVLFFSYNRLFLPRLGMAAIPTTSQLRTAQERKKCTKVPVLMPCCTWCCRIRSNFHCHQWDPFHVNATNPLQQSPEWACLCYLWSQHLSQLQRQEKRWSSLREGENMNHNWPRGKGEQRESVQSQSLSIGNVSGVGTGCINAFVIWRSAWGVSQISTPFKNLLQIYWENTLQNQITGSCSDEEQPVL